LCKSDVGIQGILYFFVFLTASYMKMKIKTFKKIKKCSKIFCKLVRFNISFYGFINGSAHLSIYGSNELKVYGWPHNLCVHRCSALLSFEFTILWVFGPMVLRFFEPMFLWTNDPMGLWSNWCIVLWANAHMSKGAHEPYGHNVILTLNQRF